MSGQLLRYHVWPRPVSTFVIATRRHSSSDVATRSHATSMAIERLKHPSRGGQNLSDRYRRLEMSLRGKETRSRRLDNLPVLSTVARSTPLLPNETRSANTFRGLRIPEEPKAPEADECCMSGCAVCLYDLHEESKNAYYESLKAFRSSLVALNIPEAEWPSSIRAVTEERSASPKNVTLDAFENMERILKERRERNYGDNNVEDTNILFTTTLSSKKSQLNTPQIIYLNLLSFCEGIRWLCFGHR